MAIKAIPSKKKLHAAVAKMQQEYVVKIRRMLHQIPELGWHETKTLAYIKCEIAKLLPLIAYESKLVELEGGIYVDIDIHPKAKRLLFRSDIDALPIEEQTGLSFSSKHKGVMHACGHDCHAAMLLGFLRAVAAGFEPTHNLRLVWQRAEEIMSMQSGGAKLVEEGVCSGVAHAYALHVSTPCENGVFFSRSGQMMANSAHLNIEIACTGGHVMRPEMGSNAIDIATEIQVALRNFVITTLGPHAPISFVPSVSNAGEAFNIMPNKVRLCYSVRNFLDPRQLRGFLCHLRTKVECIVSSFHDGKVTAFQFHQGFPILTNESKDVRNVANLLAEQGFEAKETDQLYAGEDFAFFSEHCPATFWMLGVKQGPGYDHHTALFNPDEAVLWKGVAFWLTLA